MAAYSEKPICIGDAPDLLSKSCPSVLVTPLPENIPTTLTMGTTEYAGTLRTDLPDRINRVSALLLELWKRINFINWAFSTSFTHTFKYPTVEPKTPPEPDKTVTGSAFNMTYQMLVEIDKKLNSMVVDLAEIRPVASVTESWQIRPEANRPMAAFLFGEWVAGSERIESPKWQITIPHFDPARMGEFDNTFGYEKGSYQYLFTLSDNSKIIFYGNRQDEMDIVLNRWLSCIGGGKTSGGFLKGGPIKGLQFSVRRLRLVRIDYFATGLVNSNPSSYIKFSRRPNELPLL